MGTARAQRCAVIRHKPRESPARLRLPVARMAYRHGARTPRVLARIDASPIVAGGNVIACVQALIAAQKAGIALDWQRACAIDLATKGSGKSVEEAVRTSVDPKVIDCPNAASGRFVAAITRTSTGRASFSPTKNSVPPRLRMWTRN